MPKLTDLPLQAAAKIQQYARARLGRTALRPQDVRGGRVQARAAAERRRHARRHPALGRVRDDPRAQRAPHAQRHGDHRRRRRDDVQGTRRRRERGRQRPAGDGRQGRRRCRDADPQPPLVPDRVYGAAKVGARIILLNSEFSGPQIKEVVRARGREADHLRRRVHQGGLRPTRAGQAARAADQPGQRRTVGEHRRDAGRPRRTQQRQARRPRRRSTHRSSF